MGNVERRFEQELIFNKTSVLNRYIFSLNILFVQAIDQCFLKEKLHKNKPFYVENVKKMGKC